MLASDVNNREFSDAIPNPDSVLHVEFYMNAPIRKYESEKTGKEVRGPKIPYVRIMRPGDTKSIHETPVRDDHKRRFAQKWLYFQMKEGLIAGQPEDVPGWRLEDWTELNAEQLHEMRYLRFHTVEQIAGASDAQVQRLGLGGVGMRERAKAALKARSRSEYEAEMKAKDKELSDMKERLAKLETLLTAPKQETITLPKGK